MHKCRYWCQCQSGVSGLVLLFRWHVVYRWRCWCSCGDSVKAISILFFFSLTASATFSFYHHVSLCVHGPFDSPHVTCAVSIIIFFICCQCSFTSRYLHFASAALSLTMFCYSLHVFSSLASIHALLVETLYTIFLLYKTARPLLTIYALVHVLHLEWPWHYKPLLCPPPPPTTTTILWPSPGLPGWAGTRKVKPGR